MLHLKLINSKIFMSCAILDRELSFEKKKSTQRPPKLIAHPQTHMLYCIE